MLTWKISEFKQLHLCLVIESMDTKTKCNKTVLYQIKRGALTDSQRWCPKLIVKQFIIQKVEAKL